MKKSSYYLVTNKKGKSRKLNFIEVMELLLFEYSHICTMLETEIRLYHKKVLTGDFERIEYIQEKI